MTHIRYSRQYLESKTIHFLKVIAEKLEVEKEDLLELDTKYIQENHINTVENNVQHQNIYKTNENLLNELVSSYNNQVKLLEEKVSFLEEKLKALEGK